MTGGSSADQPVLGLTGEGHCLLTVPWHKQAGLRGTAAHMSGEVKGNLPGTCCWAPVSGRVRNDLTIAEPPKCVPGARDPPAGVPAALCTSLTRCAAVLEQELTLVRCGAR